MTSILATYSPISFSAMKYSYSVAAFLVGILGQQVHAQTTAWRPFGPGFIYGFTQAASPTTLHTFRVDSAYATTTGDSVYTFNRLLRPISGSSALYTKSRNNLLGARLRWQPGTRDFYLEANAEPALGTAQAISLLLRPSAAVGIAWAASAQPVLTATLSSRTLGAVGTAIDSVATITLSNGQSILISKHYGLVQGPAWLALATGGSTWYQPGTPQAGLGFYDPQKLFALNVGDELGYDLVDYAVGSASLVCSQGYLLRRVTSRRLTADSLLVSYSEQRRATTSGAPGCSSAGTLVSPVRAGRWAISRRTGRSPQFLPFTLLTGEYTANSTSTIPTLLMGRNVSTRASDGSCLAGAQIISFVPVYPYQNQFSTYYGGLDDAAYRNEFAPTLGLGPVTLGSSINRDYSLTYYNHSGSTCGSRANFATLLPNRVAEAAIAATLHPNPAGSAATLTLTMPTPSGTVLTLTDALGRC
ncbi:MAG: hypothetical protein EOO63_12885, partial [Hymenobacter sp.]